MAITQIKGSNIADGTIVAADVAADSITNIKVASGAAIATTKLSGAVTGIASHGLGALASLATVGNGQIDNDAVTGGKLDISLVSGDVIYASGTDTLARLAKGTNGQVLKMGASIPAWGTDSAVDLTADQSWTGSQRATLAVPTWSAPNLTFDLNAGQNFSYTTVANTTINFSNIPNGQSGYIIFTNGGTHTIAKAATTKTDANLLATISATGKYILS